MSTSATASAKSWKNWRGLTTGQRERGVLQRVQPQEAGAGVAVDQRVAQAAEPDQAERELDHVLLLDLERSEADALECDWHGGCPLAGYFRKFRRDSWMIVAPDFRAAV